ncbi:DUF4179 domain-containing protein [Priestia aryabhattai]|uniref:DUF4179 domain-containing protein n=1 Tax=Priestia aryabhattai TaxID=412384 RepID=UPI00288248FD|nr:DUF4179 domain-containing protein [Priestia aryabhattai]MDT0150192.1 DUF4179 domain-containing protein [Priestia aryabhattai]MDT0155780.1 DUF4179 domain-containing protein [Priestia aryabhattai]
MKNKLKQELEQIEIPKELHIRAKLGVEKAKSEQPRRTFKKAIVFPAAAALFLIGSAGVGAATFPSFNHLLSLVSPDIALFLQPIETTSEDKGIKMKVVGAMNDDEMAVIYVTMQDLTGNRLDKTLDLYDYTLTDGHMFNSQIVNYDKDTNTATLRIQANGGTNFNNKKIKLRISSFLSQKYKHEGIKIDTDLSELKNKNVDTISLSTDSTSGGGGEITDQLDSGESIEILKPNETILSLPKIKFMHVSSIGFVNGQLHVQTKWSDEDIDSHGDFYLVDPSGKKINAASKVYYGVDKSGKTVYGNNYVEYIFNANNEDFSKLKLMGDLVSNGNFIKGNWSTTFKLHSVENEKSVSFNEDFGSWKATKMTLSSLGVTLYGKGHFKDTDNIKVSVKMNNGSSQSLDSLQNFSDNKSVKAKFLSSSPLDLSKIKAINVNGTHIEVSR